MGGILVHSRTLVSVSLFAIALAAVLLLTSSNHAPLATGETIRVGWQIPWATEGQLTQVLKHTDILANNGLTAEFNGFSSGAPLNEAALAGGVDVLFTADQPAATLLSKSDDWVIIGRLMYNRVALYVPPESPIMTVADLRGKTVGMPFGAAAQRMAVKAEKDAGLDPKVDVNNVNLGIYEQADLVKSPTAKTWGGIDALAGFDPTPAIFEEKSLARIIRTDKIVSLILMSKSFIASHPDAPTKFLRAFREAYDFYRVNTTQANAWFIADSGLNVTEHALDVSAAIEPNLNATSSAGIRISLTPEDYAIMQGAADFLFDNAMITKRVNMSGCVDTRYVTEVEGGAP